MNAPDRDRWIFTIAAVIGAVLVVAVLFHAAANIHLGVAP